MTAGEISFALANALMEYLDDKQHKERMIPDLNAGYYKKTNFEIRAVVDGQEFNFSNRFDIGDGKGSGGGSLIDHIRTICENAVASPNYPYNTPESKETPRNMLNVLVSYLEFHSALTAEEQKILDDFKEKNPIRTIDDVEKAQGKFQIYQLPSGDEYHGVRFESMDRLKADGVQLNKDDYALVYEGEVGEFRGNATLEALYTQFNIDHPEDFRGHSLSVSDVIVISVDGKDTAYFCDSFGFTPVPEFFLQREKQLTPRELLTGESIQTPRGSFLVTDMSREQLEAAGYGFHHQSEDGKYLIMGNGTDAFAIPAQQESPIKAAEMTTEQNYNMIDGVLNNAPTMSELEAKAKAGEQISLLDVAEAAKAEAQKPKQPQRPAQKQKKPSIRAQLKAAKEEQQKKPPQREKAQELEV